MSKLFWCAVLLGGGYGVATLFGAPAGSGPPTRIRTAWQTLMVGDSSAATEQAAPAQTRDLAPEWTATDQLPLREPDRFQSDPSWQATPVPSPLAGDTSEQTICWQQPVHVPPQNLRQPVQPISEISQAELDPAETGQLQLLAAEESVVTNWRTSGGTPPRVRPPDPPATQLPFESGIVHSTDCHWSQEPQPPTARTTSPASPDAPFTFAGETPRLLEPRPLEPEFQNRTAGGASELIHVVADGDTLRKLAQRYLRDEERAWEIFQLNRERLGNPELLPIGAHLRIPSDRETPVEDAWPVPASTIPRPSPPASSSTVRDRAPQNTSVTGVTVRGVGTGVAPPRHHSQLLPSGHPASLATLPPGGRLVPLRRVVPVPGQNPHARLLTPVPIHETQPAGPYSQGVAGNGP